MPRQRGQRLNFQFNKGWNTEASPLTFPEGTAQDLENVILDIDGSIRRRPGVNFDKINAVFGNTTTSTQAISMHSWENVAGSGTLAFVVSQQGTTLYFHTQDGPDTINSYIGSIDFSGYATDAVEAAKAVVATTSGLGYLFVVGEYIESFYIEYDFQSGTLSTTSINIQVRDFEGTDDGLDIDTRPSTLSNLHEYNLRNQGWPVSFPCDSGSDPLARTKAVLGVYPSNADILGYGKIENATEPNDIGKYSPSTLQKNNFGTTPAPKGKYYFNAFDINRGTIVAGATRKYTLRRPKAVAFHNGRVFYSGVNATGYTSNVYYSQQLTDVNRVGKCYQENDPTAEEFNELLATDGGLLTIPNAGGILALAEGPAGIVVFAANGIWEITGQEGKFSATEFFVRKITDMGCIGAETVINADGTLIYWSNAGIIALQPDQITSNLAPNNLTQNTIQTGYLLIGGVQQQWARGVYVPEEKKAVWLYSTNTASYNGVTNRFKYNGMLVLDIQLGAFYKYRISDAEESSPYIAGITKTTAFTSTVITDAVTAEGEVVTAGGASVTAGTSSAVGSEVEISSWKLLIVKPLTSSKLTFGEFSYDGFYDWYYHDNIGVDYSSFLETGHDTGGIPMFDKKPIYVYCYLSRYSKTRLSGGYYNLGIGSTIDYTTFCGDISTITYDNQFYNSSAQTGAYAPSPSTSLQHGIGGTSIAEDGSKIVIHNRAGQYYAYDLSSVYDISTATYNGEYALISQNSVSNHGSKFGNSGLKFYVNEASVGFYEYDLSTAYDITTATYTGNVANISGSNKIYNGELSSDGTKLYLVSYTNVNQLYEYNLSTPFDISTRGTAVNNVNLGSFGITDTEDIRINTDGTNFYVLDEAGVTVYQMSMSTPYDISTLSVVGTFSFQTLVPGLDPHSFCMNDNFNVIYLSTFNGETTYQFNFNC